MVVVNRTFAERYFGKQSPVGRNIGFFGQDPRTAGIRIVGEVEDSLYAGPRGGRQRQIFFSYLEASFLWPANFYVRTYADPASLYPVLRRVVASADRTVPVYDLKTLDRRLDETLSTERLIAVLSIVFGALATVMAALGLYGVMAFSVVRRTNEIGLRLALGARQASVLWMVLREVSMLLAGGAGGRDPVRIFTQPLCIRAVVWRDADRSVDLFGGGRGSCAGGWDCRVRSCAARQRDRSDYGFTV